MFKFFSQNTIGAYIMLPLLLVALRLRLILFPHEGFTPTTENLYTPLWTEIFGCISEGSTLSITLSIIITLVIALIINGISNRFHFTEHQSLLAALYYILLTSGFVISHGLHPIHLFAVFFCIAIICLFKAADIARPMATIYNAFFYYSIGWLFWGKGLWLMPIMFIMPYFLRAYSFRSILAALMGLSTPLITYATWLFLKNSLVGTTTQFIHTCTMHLSFFHMGAYTISYAILYALTILFAILNSIGKLTKLSITESRYTRSLIIATLLTSLLIILPQFTFETMQIVAIGGGILIATTINQIHSKTLAEFITTIMLIVTIVVQWIVKG